MDNTLLIALVGASATMIGGLIVFFANRQLNKANALHITGNTIINLSRRIDELEKRDSEKEKRIDELENMVKRYARALERAIKHIKSLAPEREVPDFLMDTGDHK